MLNKEWVSASPFLQQWLPCNVKWSLMQVTGWIHGESTVHLYVSALSGHGHFIMILGGSQDVVWKPPRHILQNSNQESWLTISYAWYPAFQTIILIAHESCDPVLSSIKMNLQQVIPRKRHILRKITSLE